MILKAGYFRTFKDSQCGGLHSNPCLQSLLVKQVEANLQIPWEQI